MFTPRPMQAQVIAYTGGKMGVAAVPGSGKTQTLSVLAARLIAEGYVEADQEVLIVTLVNSAVENFSSRIRDLIREHGLIPGMGYRVRTLHGLAHDIVRERPDLVGLSERFQIIDERESAEILKNSVQSWLRSHPEFMLDYTKPDIDLAQNWKLQQAWGELAVDLAGSFIKTAKDLQMMPETIRQLLDPLNIPQPLLELGCDVYTDYQRALSYRSAVDFQDLIRLALIALQSDADFLERLRYRWPYVLEDEAQDSSRLQEFILGALSGPGGNWVRVGDPNQAIYETFTTASPQHLLDFLIAPDVQHFRLPNSGRSTRSIISLANQLVRWTNSAHPVPALRKALFDNMIEPTPPNDPQPNPQVENPANSIVLHDKKLEPDQEIELVARSLSRWLPANQDKTVAVLVPRNARGTEMVEALKRANIEVVELLQSSESTRQTAGILSTVMQYLYEPMSYARLVEVYTKLRPDKNLDAENREVIRRTKELLRRCHRLEDYLRPSPGEAWLEALGEDEAPPPVREQLEWLRPFIVRWQEAALLPVDQLMLTIAQDIFTDPVDLALAHKLALLLERAADMHPAWHLPEFCIELNTIVDNQRKYLGFGEEDNGFDPDKYCGKVVVATIHKAKGLEWDRVYLLSANNYDFPSAQPQDTYISERWFVRQQLNLPAEALAKLKYLLNNDIIGVYQEEGIATRQSRLDYAAERLRLLYVGITRARRELIITWNSGRNGDCQPTQAFFALQRYWHGQSE